MKALILSFILVGCFTPKPFMPEVKGVDYLRYPPLSVPVKSIRVFVEGVPSSPVGNLRISLVDMIKQWTEEHLYASGHSGCLNITVKEAEAKEIALPPHSDPLSWMKVEATEKNYARITLCLEWVTEGSKKSQVIVSVVGENYIPENYRIQERRALLLSLYEDLLNRLTREVDRVLPPLFKSSF